jgi:TetR/AcrR family transcriptional regulator
MHPPPASARLPTEERQALIVAAAIALAGRNSPAAITTGDIAREVGVTQGALFKHFPSREAIWLAVMEWVTQHLLARLENAAKTPTGQVLPTRHSTPSPGSSPPISSSCANALACRV